jgi:hypothetical protein
MKSLWRSGMAIHLFAIEAGIRLTKAPCLLRRVFRHDCAPLFESGRLRVGYIVSVCPSGRTDCGRKAGSK